VDYVFFTTVTGVGAPSLDVELAQAMGFRSDVKRIPSFGLGCVAGAAGLARVNDLLRGDPEAIAVLVSLELCSLTVQWDDASMANIVGTGLFGDGAAAMVLAGAERCKEPIAWIRGSRSALYPDSTETIGWNIGSYGFRLMLTPAVPDLIDRHLAADVDALLVAHGVSRSDVDEWIAHPGGPRVLEAFSEALDLAPGDLATSWEVLADAGNMSSSAVLHVLARNLKSPPGHIGLLFALGPGVSVEMVLLEWR
jgi:Predicted naringenin-chalcone synthase